MLLYKDLFPCACSFSAVTVGHMHRYLQTSISVMCSMHMCDHVILYTKCLQRIPSWNTCLSCVCCETRRAPHYDEPCFRLRGLLHLFFSAVACEHYKCISVKEQAVASITQSVCTPTVYRHRGMAASACSSGSCGCQILLARNQFAAPKVCIFMSMGCYSASVLRMLQKYASLWAWDATLPVY